MERTIQLNDLAGIEPFSSSFSRLGDNYILTRISDEIRGDSTDTTSVSKPPFASDRPLRLNGLLLVLVPKGTLQLQINVDPYTASQGDMFVVSPGSLVCFNNIEQSTECLILFVSSTFLHSINIDLNAIDIRSLISRPSPVMRLNEREAVIIRKYFELLDINAESKSDSIFARQIARSLISTIVYELFRFSFDHLGLDDAQNSGTSQRPLNYVHDFINLLHLHFSRERNISFYAEKLCISPKYLSMITKMSTGRSATDWINEFVILEAKNLLRFSGKSIQQVAYTLNFSSQSAFGKYFKRVTGQSPSDFQKS